jgi:proteasome lid subunit RPN8/RPN11
MPLDRARQWVSQHEESGYQALIPAFVAQSAYRHLVEHAASDMDQEVGGILVGEWSVDEAAHQQFITVEAALPARFTRQGSVYLTFTQDSLVDIHAEMDEHYPDKQIVGWYHTHPGMGIFLSPFDTWLHRHFFPEPWQVALVIEPHSSTGGFFIRQAGGALDPGRYFGFYELDGQGQSIVDWNNLRPKPEETVSSQ